MKKLTIVYKPELLTALGKNHVWCDHCKASGEIYVGYVMRCPVCQGKCHHKKGAEVTVEKTDKRVWTITCGTKTLYIVAVKAGDDPWHDYCIVDDLNADHYIYCEEDHDSFPDGQALNKAIKRAKNYLLQGAS